MNIYPQLRQHELEAVRRLPPRLSQPNRRFCAWRVLLRNDFKRLRPIPISRIAQIINASYAKTITLLTLHRWTCIPRKSACDLQLWHAPFDERFAEVSNDF